MVSELHQRLENVVVQGIGGDKINLFGKFAEIKAKASEWLRLHEKNGIEHSERLEEYLVKLTQKLRIKENSENANKYRKIQDGEIFILLCAAYLHDIGYWHNGKLDPINHPQRSHDRIINNPDEYLLGDFPLFKGEENRVAKAIALVCLGHSEEKYVPLEVIPKEFADQNLCPIGTMNLRMLAALLRLADETDDPYVRMVDGSFHTLRSNTPLVVVGDETIAWHWQDANTTDPKPFLNNLEEKKKVLVTAIDYLQGIQCGNWYLVLHPQVPGSSPFMAEKPTITFVGREDDLEKIHAIIQQYDAGAVTGVVGTGGIGKTELARMYAKKYQAEYPGGIFWASLKGSNWKNEAPKILTELRPGADLMVFPDDNQAREAITKALDRKHSLLVIDNVDEFDDIIKPTCRVLVTTRNKDAFGTVPHDAVHRLDKLDMEAALELLSKLIGSGRVEQDRPGAERLVEILGGMPLALEIAARHLVDVPDFIFPDYIGRIENRIDLLTVENEEDKNVLASLEVSLDSLKTLENGTEFLNLFFSSTVCAATGFTSDTLIATAGLEEMDIYKAKKLVGKLYRRSLLEFHKESNRYSLHALVRQMAETKLRADEEAWKKFTQNHCEYWVRYASIHRNDSIKLIEEKDGLWQAMVQTNQVRELQDLFPRLLEAMSEPYWKTISHKNYESGFQYLMETKLHTIEALGKYKDTLELFDPLVKHKNELEELSVGRLFNVIGSAYMQLGQYGHAIDYYQQSLKMFRLCSNGRGEGNTLNNLGLAFADLGEYQIAIDYYQHSLDISRRIGYVQGESNALINLGWAYVDLGEYQTAIDYCQQSLDISRRNGNIAGEGRALGNMGSIYRQLGQYRNAIDYYKKSLEISRRNGDLRGEGNILGNIGTAHLQLGEYQTAIDYCQQSLKISRSIGDLRWEGNVQCNLGSIYLHLGQYQTAIAYYQQSLKISHRVGDVRGEGYALGNIGTVFLQTGLPEKAIDYYEIYLRIARRTGDVHEEGNALGNMGLAYAKLGNKDRAKECLEASIAIFRRLGLEHMVEQRRRMMAREGIEVD
jgi:tetratricopeptide (TPR) repeat protein/TusA-related sulfurtransferase